MHDQLDEVIAWGEAINFCLQKSRMPMVGLVSLNLLLFQSL